MIGGIPQNMRINPYAASGTTINESLQNIAILAELWRVSW